MVFSSLIFICVFMPVVFGLYLILPWTKAQNALLIIASLLFYAYGEPVFVLLMIGSSLLNYVFALLIEKSEGNVKKACLAINVILNIGILIAFKYTGMFLTSINSIAGTSINIPKIALPLGISFFTFQAMSYVIDVYRNVSKAQKNYFKVLLYISFFPQLIAGPIVKYHDISKALDEREKSVFHMAHGFRRFAFGMAKKVLIANAMAVAVDAVYSMKEINAALAWIAAVGYMLQIYFDFSGYSDMAIGLGSMFGFKFPENFNYPYAASSIKDFWRRWHISLSGWFKDYLYIPLGGNRKGRVRTGFNKLIVFFCTGLWHGANWTFVIWGLFHGFFSVLEEYIKLPKNIVTKCLGHIYALLVICIGFVIFRAENMKQAFTMVKAMFTGFNTNTDLTINTLSVLTIIFVVTVIVALVAALPVKVRLNALANKWGKAGNAMKAFSYVIALVLLFVCMISLAGNGYNPFIYFRF